MYVTRQATKEELAILRAIADYQFGVGLGYSIIPGIVYLRISRTTGRIRAILDENGKVLFTFRAYTHTLIPSLYGALLIHRSASYPRLRCVVASEVADEVAEHSSTVFARHVLYIDENLRAGDEILVVDESDRLLCTGTLKISPREVVEFIRGSAVRVRECLSAKTS